MKNRARSEWPFTINSPKSTGANSFLRTRALVGRLYGHEFVDAFRARMADKAEWHLENNTGGGPREVRGEHNVPRERFLQTQDGSFVWAGQGGLSTHDEIQHEPASVRRNCGYDMLRALRDRKRLP